MTLFNVCVICWPAVFLQKENGRFITDLICWNTFRIFLLSEISICSFSIKLCKNHEAVKHVRKNHNEPVNQSKCISLAN